MLMKREGTRTVTSGALDDHSCSQANTIKFGTVAATIEPLAYRKENRGRRSSVSTSEPWNG